MDVQSEIKSRFAGLTPALQQAARFVLDNPNEVVIGSMRTIASKASVPPATLVRFAQTMGFAGWPQLKEAFAVKLGLAPDEYGHRAQSLVRRRADGQLTGEMFGVQRHNLDLTEKHSSGSLKRAARLLAKGAHVHVAGYRASFGLAYTLVYEYRLFRKSVQLLDGQGGSLEMQLRSVDAHDVVVIIAFSPYSKEAIAVAEAAQEAKCKVIAITDSVASPLSLVAHETLIFSATSPSFFPSIAAAQALIEALLELLVSQAGKDVVQQIHKAEKQLFESGAYLRSPPVRKKLGDDVAADDRL